jgi:CRISPR-associated protein Csb1
MSNILEQFDHYLKADGPAAIVTREPLIPVEGADGVFFPPTFAASKDKTFEGGYNIDGDPNGKNVALIDSVGSQANRIEPIFAEPEQAALVPQVVITAGTKKINLLEAGHRGWKCRQPRQNSPHFAGLRCVGLPRYPSKDAPAHRFNHSCL